MTTLLGSPTSLFYGVLLGEVDEHILHLQDEHGVFFLDKLNEAPIKYFLKKCLNTPWKNQLLFGMLIEGDRNYDTSTE